MLVELTTSKDKPIFINPDHVIRVEWYNDEFCRLYVTDKETYIGVRGSAREVAEQLDA